MRRFAMLLALLSSGTIAFVAPSPLRADTMADKPEPVARIFAAPTSPQTTGPEGEVPWGLDRIDQRTASSPPKSFAFSTLGSGVDVYVVDTGIKATHPGFDGRVLDGWSYRADTEALASYNESRLDNNFDPNMGIPLCPTNNQIQTYSPSTFDNPPSIDTADKGNIDNNGHGTHVAGSIGGNSTGVAKGVDLIPVRVLDSCGSGNFTMIFKGLSWVLAHHTPGVPAVVNLSLGFPEVVEEIDLLIAQLLAEGVVVVAAAGNIPYTDYTDLGNACDTTPADTPGTISVASSNESDNESSFSYYGDCVDIFAPGESIMSTWPKNFSFDTYALDTGTSMAAPHIAGAVARFVQGTTVSAGTPAAAWSWLKLNATCNAITYYTPPAFKPSRLNRPKTPNRLLAVDAPAITPCAPSSVKATSAPGTITVTWDPVASDNGSATLDYTVTLSPGDRTCTRLPTETLSCVFTGITSGVAYTASVRAQNAIGYGESSSASTAPDLPKVVTGMTAVVNANVLKVSWSKGAGDETGVTYTATATPGGEFCTTTSATCSIPGLTLGTEYTVTVVGVNSFGTGPSASTVVTFVRPPLAVWDMTATVVGNSFVISWQQATGDTTGITYTATAIPGGSQCTSTSTGCSITGLTVGTEYTITVVGVNTIGTGAGSTIVTVFSRVPLAVAKLVATPANNALDISWEKGSGEAAGTKYTATATPGNFSCTSTSTSCSIESLVNGTEYNVSVVGVNVYGTSVAATAKGTPDGAPEVPLKLQSVLSKRTIKLSWPAVSTTADVTYVVSSRPGNLMCTTALTTCEVTGLSYGVDYSFVITTRSASGLTSSAALIGSARPGYKVKKTTVKRGSSTLLTSFLTPLSTGKRTWSETGPCAIRGTRLVAPKKITKCILILKVAKKGSYPTMSTRLAVTVK